MKYLLDSNVLLHLANQSAGYRLIHARLYALKSNARAISAIAAFELRHMLIERKVSKDKLDALGRTFVTDDADFGRIPGLTVENWRVPDVKR